MKTNSTHTPGQWRIGDAGHTVFGPPNGKPSPETIAACPFGNPHSRANARLIAAAPDLLAALRDLVEQTTRYINDDDCDLPDVTEARAAIAKAEGRS